MSWDLLLLSLPAEVRSADELPDDYRSEPLGRHQDIQMALRSHVPDVDLADPTWGHLAGEAWSIELNIGRGDPVDSIMLHVRGTGDAVISQVFRIAAAVDARVLDCADGGLLTPDGTSNWQAFQQFRDAVITSDQTRNDAG
jgi:hypothetical protein